MHERPDSLRLAFGLDEESMRGIREKLGASRAALELLRDALSGAAPGLAEGFVEQLGKRVDEVLDTPLSGILAAAWRTYAPFLRYCDPKAYPPGDTQEVELESHTVRAALQPYVEVSVNGQRVGRIDLSLEVSVRLEAAILVVRDGRFMELRTGRSAFSGTLSAEGVRLAHTERPRALPGRISFGEGIPIRPLSGGAATPDAVAGGPAPSEQLLPGVPA